MLLLTSFFQWWYGDGWRRQAKMISSRIDGMTDFFSFSLLLKTLFAPYRQISAGKVDGPLEVQLRALADRIFSRAVGAVVRLLILGIGSVALGTMVIYSFIYLLGWALSPLFPIVGLILALTGWTP